MIIFTSFLIFSFAVSWGPVAWIIPAEIFPSDIREKAVSLSSAFNWISGAATITTPFLFPIIHISGNED
jgi:SP family sugar:H+ symporter-like MFS transporter